MRVSVLRACTEEEGTTKREVSRRGQERLVPPCSRTGKEPPINPPAASQTLGTALFSQLSPWTALDVVVYYILRSTRVYVG